MIEVKTGSQIKSPDSLTFLMEFLILQNNIYMIAVSIDRNK